MSVEIAASGSPAGVRIGINAHLLSGEAGYRRAGIHQYIYQVLRHLPATAAYTVFTRQPQLLADLPHLQTAVTAWPTEQRLVRILWEQLVWAWTARRLQLDLLHSMAFVTPLAAPCPTVVTVYDLSFELFPDRFPTTQRRYLQSQTRRSCRHARRIITISESGRQDVHRLFAVPLERIDVVMPGLDEMYQPRPLAEVAAFRRQRGLPDRFVLHVGTLQPRKNLLVLLEAFAQLALKEVKLVLVGGKGWFFAEIFQRMQALQLAKRVIFAGYVPDEELPLWYSAASVLALPSVYEGFGLPVVEAMACGTPVVAAASSSLPEAGGKAARYFAPHAPGELAAQLTAVLSEPEIARQMRAAGLDRAVQFSWNRAGRETAASYSRALR